MEKGSGGDEAPASVTYEDSFEKIKGQDIERMFAQLDTNHDGVLDAAELRQGLRKLGHKMDKDDVEVGQVVFQFSERK